MWKNDRKPWLIRAAGAVLATVLGFAATPAHAGLIVTGSGTSTDTNNTVSAQVTFTLLPNNVLQIILCNTSPNPEAIRRGDTLTGVIWDMDGTDPALSGLTISQGTSTVYTGPNTPNASVDLAGTWIYQGMPGGPYTYTNNSATFEYGISAIGGGVFGGAQGDDYGLIASAASLDNSSFSNSAFPLIVNCATFTLNGFTAGLDQIKNVKFTFGSGPNYVLRGTPQTVVPEPSTAVLGAMGIASLGLMHWRRRRTA